MTRDEAIEYIKEVHFGYLATVSEDNRPRVRPVGIDTIYGDDIYFFTMSVLPKCSEIEANPNVEVVWSKLDKVSQVHVKGQASVVEDEGLINRFKEENPMVSKALPEGTEHLFRLYKITPEEVEMAEGLVPYTEIDWYS